MPVLTLRLNQEVGLGLRQTYQWDGLQISKLPYRALVLCFGVPVASLATWGIITQALGDSWSIAFGVSSIPRSRIAGP